MRVTVMRVSVAVVLLCSLVLTLLPGADAIGFRGFRVRPRLPKVSVPKVSVPEFSVPKISIPKISVPKDFAWSETNSFPRIEDGEKISCILMTTFEVN